MAYTAAKGSPRRFAHRGVAQAAPENTLGAFEAADALGLEGIELDVHLTRDGVPVVIHDGNLTRLTAGHPSKHTNLRVPEATLAELRAVELPYANHTLPVELPEEARDEFLALRPNRVLGQESPSDYIAALAAEPRMAKIMTLKEFLDWFAARRATLEVEIEVCQGGLAKPIFELLEGHAAVPRCILFSGSPAHIAEMQTLAARQGKPAGLRFGANIRRLTEEAKKEIAGMDLFEVGLNAEAFTADDLAWLEQHGIVALSNLGDYPAWWQTLCGLNVYGFKTNYAQAFTQWALARAGQ